MTPMVQLILESRQAGGDFDSGDVFLYAANYELENVDTGTEIKDGSGKVYNSVYQVNVY